MKQTKFLKTLSFVLVAIVTAVAFASCSSDKDEPNNPDNSGNGNLTDMMIPASYLPGTWTIESIKDSETGKVTEINQTVTFSDFEVKQSLSNIVNGDNYQFWAESYEGILSYAGMDAEADNTVIFAFCKDKHKGLTSSLIYELTFSTDVFLDDTSVVRAYSLADLHLSGNVLQANASTYGVVSFPPTSSIRGVLTMKKL